MTELLVGTKKGLFELEGDAPGEFEVTARAFAGQSVEYAMRDPRTGRYLASVTSWFYGPKIWVTDDPAGEWEQADGIELPEDGDAALARIWVIAPGEADGVLYAGGDPGPLFESRDGGLTLGAQPRSLGAPDAAGLAARGTAACASTRSCRGPATRTACSSRSRPSASGCTEDGGQTWELATTGSCPRTCPRRPARPRR